MFIGLKIVALIFQVLVLFILFSNKSFAKALFVNSEVFHIMSGSLCACGATAGEDLLVRCTATIHFMRFEAFNRQKRDMLEGSYFFGSAL